MDPTFILEQRKKVTWSDEPCFLYINSLPGRGASLSRIIATAILHIVWAWFEEHDEDFKMLPWPLDSLDFPFKSIVGCVGTRSLIHTGFTSQLKGSANILVPDITGHNSLLCRVNVLANQSCLAARGGLTAY